MTSTTQTQTCRFYENKLPEVEDVVVVKVQSIAEMGAYVNLVEYNNIEGMILLSELSRRRIRSINKLIRVGRIEYVVVLRVDQEQGYIDLSKRRVSKEEIRKCEEKVSKARAVNSILRHVAQTEGANLEELYETIAWTLKKTFPSPFDAFKQAVTDPSGVLGGLGLEKNVYDTLVANIKLRMTPQPLKIRADIEVSCTKYEGVDAVKRALKAGLAVATNDDVEIHLRASPKFVVSTQATDKEAGIALVQDVIDKVKDTIESEGGVLKVAMEPRVTSQEEMDDLFNESDAEDDNTDDEEDEEEN